MGMYTGVRAKLVIKDEFVPMIQLMMEESLDWHEIQEKMDVPEEIKQYADCSRSSFIPRGALAYMPDEWEQEPYDEYHSGVPTDGFDRKFDPETKVWSFQCSLKNYDDTIEEFFKLVVPLITKEIIHLEEYYEKWETSVLYELKDGKVEESEKPGIRYIPLESEDNMSNYWFSMEESKGDGNKASILINQPVESNTKKQIQLKKQEGTKSLEAKQTETQSNHHQTTQEDSFANWHKQQETAKVGS